MKYIWTITTAFLLVLTLPSVSPSGAGIEWDILNQEAVELHGKGQYNRAVVVAKKALEITEKNGGPHHPDVANTLNNLATLYKTQGQYTPAERLRPASQGGTLFNVYQAALHKFGAVLGLSNHDGALQHVADPSVPASLSIRSGDFVRLVACTKRNDGAQYSLFTLHRGRARC